MSPVRLGIVVPSANPTVEPELNRLLPAGVVPYVARMTAPAGADLRTRLRCYRDGLDETLASLSGLGLGAVLVACTGSSYPLGPDGDREWAHSASRRFGSPVITAAGAILMALHALRVDRLSLISPYPAWLTEQSVAFWRAAGFDAGEPFQLDETGTIYDTDCSAVRGAVLDCVHDGAPEGRAVLVTGTGAPSLDVLDELGESSAVPLLSSNVAGCWALLQVAAAERLSESTSPALLRLARVASAPRPRACAGGET